MKNIQSEGTSAAPQKNTANLSQFESNNQAALYWFDFGFNVIPVIRHSKTTALRWNPWLRDLSPEKITRYWFKKPDCELGFIVGDDIIVFDADSQESIVALAGIEKALELTPNLVVKTNKGEHHYYRRAKNTFAKSDSHSSKEFPNRIDVKTGRAMLILPPSTDKEIEICEASGANDLTEIGQDVIDAVFRHNGRPVPRPTEMASSLSRDTQAFNAARLKALLNHLDPDCGYEDWLHILMAIYYETAGCEEGFELANTWCSKGTKYKGSRDIRGKWNSFKSSSATPITIGTLIQMVEAKGFDWRSVCSEAEDPFEICDNEISLSSAECNPLDKFSLRGMSSEIEKSTVDAVPVLGQIALTGQSTVFHAAPNTGKTLITLSLLIEAINKNKVNPSKVYYLNMDDTGKGLLEKLHIAEEYGFHMLVDGFRGFTAGDFLGIVRGLAENDQAKDVVIILDTLKKFVDLMDKKRSSDYAKIIRQFVVKGGTLVALAHTNKNPNSYGKQVYCGTSDIIDDSDCAYTLDTVSKEGNEKVVVFEKIKGRGNVVETAAYRYSSDHTASYTEILLSIAPVDESRLKPLKQAEQLKSDAEIIGTIKACISEGINSKMKLADATAERAGVSKRNALKIIDKYTGETEQHVWKFTVGDRGAKLFVLLEA